MNILFSIEYRTTWGEELVLCVGEERYKMSYHDGGIWEAEVPVPALVLSPTGSTSVCSMATGIAYHYEVVKGGEVVRREWYGHILEPSDLSAISSQKPSESSPESSKSNQKPSESSPESSKSSQKPSESSPESSKSSQKPSESSPESSKSSQKSSKDAFRHVDWWISKPTEDRSRRMAGTAVPVFSLRTENDFGVGEFQDIKLLVDWAVKTDQSIIQLLPINDTTMTGTWMDSYPYNANTTFALHPMYVNLPMAGLKVDKEYKDLQKKLNGLKQIDYVMVNQEKTRLMHKLFDETYPSLGKTKAYRNFISRNESWLTPYAAFCTLRDINGTPEFGKWGEYATYDEKKIKSFIAKHKSEFNFHCFVQYHLDIQLSDAVAYAHKHGVVLKGDLPIGISRTSVDAWLYPRLFNMDSQAGAPPDAFSEDGQNWGFPTYNWEEMSKDGYAWWKSRLGKMAEYFDAFRIDHVLGFFRIWEIPADCPYGLLGYFNPAMPYSSEELRQKGFDMNDKRYSVPAEGAGPRDVLFIEDRRRKGFWHPRISAQNTQIYKSLTQWQKDTFNWLHDDFFYRRHTDFWWHSAMKKLPDLLGSTTMLACGEDLGMIPACVPDVMNRLGILSLEIQRMPKSPSEEFANPYNYPYMCVCTTSTHDMTPIRAWWEEDKTVTDHFYHNMLGGQGETPEKCETWICEKIIRQHLESPAMFTILPLQDWLSIDEKLRYPKPEEERINVPVESRHYWRYRLHLTIEKMIAANDWDEKLRSMVTDSGRVC